MEIIIGLVLPFVGTMLGSAIVFLLNKGMGERVEKLLLGFAAGVMVAASIWSLLLPSLEMSADTCSIPWLPTVAGFLCGMAFLLLLDSLTPHLHLDSDMPEGVHSNLKKTTMLVLAVTLHNIPEGMAIGIILAGAIGGSAGLTLAGALALSIGIAIQNIPEGAIVSMPLERAGRSKWKAFGLGTLSGAVEPLAGLITILMTSLIINIMPHLLAFAAGAMIYVVVEELIPESQSGKHSNIATIGVAIGFALMMVLDTAVSFESKPNALPSEELDGKGVFDMRGVVLVVDDDLTTVDWPSLAAKNGINTIGTHIFPDQVVAFSQSAAGQHFYESCKKHGIDVEHQLHAMSQLLPRELFAEDSTMFRMDDKGRRTPQDNCCVHSEKALETIAQNAVKYAKLLPPTNHRYYFWIDDGKPMCKCPECSSYSPSEQALIIENRILKALREEVDKDAMLAHLAYLNTLEAPVKIKPEEGIFLEYAPIFRSFDAPISKADAINPRDYNKLSHADYLRFLEDNLKVFPAETTVILEYWLDASLFSYWKKPAVQIPWDRQIFLADLDTYASYGIKNITSFAAYMDSTYFATYPDKTFLMEYGMGLKDYGKKEPIPFVIHKISEKKGNPLDPESAFWKNVEPYVGFHAPWDGLKNETDFRCAATKDRLYFRFEVKDSTPCTSTEYNKETDVMTEDRVEVFFSPVEGMRKKYYCAEVDNMGRTLDYSADFFRHFDNDWNFSSIKNFSKTGKEGYSTVISFSIAELEALDINLKKGFFFGAYQADYRKDGSVNWYSLKYVGDKTADFHKPDMLFPAIVK